MTTNDSQAYCLSIWLLTFPINKRLWEIRSQILQDAKLPRPVNIPKTLDPGPKKADSMISWLPNKVK